MITSQQQRARKTCACENKFLPSVKLCDSKRVFKGRVKAGECVVLVLFVEGRWRRGGRKIEALSSRKRVRASYKTKPDALGAKHLCFKFRGIYYVR